MPGVVTFSPSLKRIFPTMVSNSVLAMCSRIALRSRPTFSTDCWRICSPAQACALADLLAARGVKTAAVVYVDELFGLETVTALEAALKAKHIEIVDKKSYPLGVKDLSPVLRDFKAKNPDAFLGITYPPEDRKSVV